MNFPHISTIRSSANVVDLKNNCFRFVEFSGAIDIFFQLCFFRGVILQGSNFSQYMPEGKQSKNHQDAQWDQYFLLGWQLNAHCPDCGDESQGDSYLPAPFHGLNNN